MWSDAGAAPSTFKMEPGRQGAANLRTTRLAQGWVSASSVVGTSSVCRELPAAQFHGGSSTRSRRLSIECLPTSPGICNCNLHASGRPALTGMTDAHRHLLPGGPAKTKTTTRSFPEHRSSLRILGILGILAGYSAVIMICFYPGTSRLPGKVGCAVRERVYHGVDRRVVGVGYLISSPCGCGLADGAYWR